MAGTVDACLIDRNTGLPIGISGNPLPTTTVLTGTTNTVVATGNVASGVADSGNPVKVGGKYNGTSPTLTDGQRSDIQLDQFGNTVVALSGGATTADTAGVFIVQPFNGNKSANYPLAISAQLYNGSAMLTQRGDTNGAVMQSGLSSTFWNYAAATSGIVNSAVAVTIKVAAGASIRNYLKTLYIDHDALGVATEIAIRDGAAGTVLWRGKLQTAMIEGKVLTFDPPLKGTANTLMEVITLTASVTGGVFVNATGFTGS